MMHVPVIGRHVPAFIALALLSSCVLLPSLRTEAAPKSAESESGPIVPPTTDTPALPSPGDMQKKLSTSARGLVGLKTIKIDGQSFNADCTGTVLAAFYAAGIDLRPGFTRVAGGNGVERLWNLMEEKKLLTDTKIPQAGSLLFWDDTYDRNGDGLRNDPFCHVGVVVEANESGDVRYVHFHYTKGVIEESMNLLKPAVYRETRDGLEVEINSPLRMKSWKPDPQFLSGELYRRGAEAWEYKE